MLSYTLKFHMQPINIGWLLWAYFSYSNNNKNKYTWIVANARALPSDSSTLCTSYRSSMLNLFQASWGQLNKKSCNNILNTIRINTIMHNHATIFSIFCITPPQVGAWRFRMPNLPSRRLNGGRPKALVNVSASCARVGTYEGWRWPWIISLRTKWQSTSMCFVHSWRKWFGCHWCLRKIWTDSTS